jgi:hypothetical protein
MPERFIDFDAARAERNDEPMRLRAYGQDFDLPAQLPAALFLDVVRMSAERGDDADINGADAVRLLSRILPKDVLQSLLDRDDFDMDALIELTGMVMAAYQGESPAPNRAARRHPPAAKSTRSRGSRAGSTVPSNPASPGTAS